MALKPFTLHLNAEETHEYLCVFIVCLGTGDLNMTIDRVFRECMSSTTSYDCQPGKDGVTVCLCTTDLCNGKNVRNGDDNVTPTDTYATSDSTIFVTVYGSDVTIPDTADNADGSASICRAFSITLFVISALTLIQTTLA